VWRPLFARTEWVREPPECETVALFLLSSGARRGPRGGDPGVSRPWSARANRPLLLDALSQLCSGTCGAPPFTARIRRVHRETRACHRSPARPVAGRARTGSRTRSRGSQTRQLRTRVGRLTIGMRRSSSRRMLSCELERVPRAVGYRPGRASQTAGRSEGEASKLQRQGDGLSRRGMLGAGLVVRARTEVHQGFHA